MSYSGFTSYQQGFTEVMHLGYWLESLCNQESFKHLGFCTSHNERAAAIRTEDTQLFTSEATVLTEGELTAGYVLGTTGL